MPDADPREGGYVTVEVTRAILHVVERAVPPEHG